MWEIFILFFIALVFYFDLKARIIPDVVNFFFMFLAIALAILKYEFDVSILLYSYAPFFILSFAFAYGLYRLGVWAGGDVKFFAALMAFMPSYLPAGEALDNTAPFSVFITSALVLIPITMVYNFSDIFVFRGVFRRLFVDSIINSAKATALSFSALFILSRFAQVYDSPLLILAFLILSLMVRIPLKIALPIMLVGFFFLRLEDYVSLVLVLFFASLFLQFIRGAFGVISKRVLTKVVAVSNLREGLIPAETIYISNGKLRRWSPEDAFRQINRLLSGGVHIRPYRVFSDMKPKGKIIADSLKARGLTAGEIKQLKSLRVKQILVKESLPFAPVIAAAFLIYRYWDVLAFLGL
ncbi:MAG: prepilin peptidase [Candidatus Micrarchaeota archaeon]